jgi:hypothetical protein
VQTGLKKAEDAFVPTYVTGLRSRRIVSSCGGGHHSLFLTGTHSTLLFLYHAKISLLTMGSQRMERCTGRVQGPLDSWEHPFAEAPSYPRFSRRCPASQFAASRAEAITPSLSPKYRPRTSVASRLVEFTRFYRRAEC